MAHLSCFNGQKFKLFRSEFSDWNSNFALLFSRGRRGSCLSDFVPCDPLKWLIAHIRTKMRPRSTNKPYGSLFDRKQNPVWTIFNYCQVWATHILPTSVCFGIFACISPVIHCAIFEHENPRKNLELLKKANSSNCRIGKRWKWKGKTSKFEIKRGTKVSQGKSFFYGCDVVGNFSKMR